MSAVLAVAEALGHGVLRSATELASLAWLAVIGVPETITHATRVVAYCRGLWSRCLDNVARRAVGTSNDWRDHDRTIDP